MKNFRIVYKNNAMAQRVNNYRAQNEIEAINKLLSYCQIKQIVSVTEITTPEMFEDKEWNQFLGR